NSQHPITAWTRGPTLTAESCDTARDGKHMGRHRVERRPWQVRPGLLWVGRLTAEGLVVFCGTVGLAALLHVVTATGGHPLVGRVQPLLAAVTAGLAAVASLLCLLSSRLRADGEMRVVGYAWG